VSKLSPEAAAVLAAARKDLGASAEVVARVKSAVAARVNAEPPPSGVKPRTGWSTVGRFGHIAAFGLLGGAFVAGYVASSRTVTPNAITVPSESSAEDARPSEPPHADSPDDGTPSELANPIPTLPLASLPDRPLPRAERAPRVREPHVRRPPIEPATAEVKPNATTGDDLVEESRLLRAAQLDLQAHRAAAAQRSIEEHAQRFPMGVLREERLTLRVLALCEAGAVDAARRARAELDRSFPATSHASRLATSCAAADPEGAR